MMPSDKNNDIAYWQGMVIYQIYPRSFHDSNNDGIGDLAGITSKLDYVASLGVDGVWISPFFTSPMRDFGYDISDFCDVDPQFGTLKDFDELVAKAHDLGLKVIIDQVYSHSSDRHDWFRESRRGDDNPKADWYVWADAKEDGSPPNNWQSVFMGPAWSWDTVREKYYLHNFLREQPDLNVHNPEVQDAILDAAKFWLDRGVDGFRMDAVNHFTHNRELPDNPPAPKRPGQKPFDRQHHLHNQSQPETPIFLERFRKMLDQYPGRFSIAEIGGENALSDMKDYTLPSKRLHTAYSFVFLEAPELTVKTIRDAVESWSSEHDGWPSFTFSNHDRIRAMTRWSRNKNEENDQDFGKFLNMLLLTLRGSICLYQGEELALPQATVAYEDLQDPEAIANWPETLGRDGTRSPLPWQKDAPNAGFSNEKPWLPMAKRYNDLAIDIQENTPLSCLHFTRQILAFRKQHAALITGDIKFLDTQEPILAFERSSEDETLLCLFNLSEKPANTDITVNPDDVLFAHQYDGRSNILPATSGVIAKIMPHKTHG